MTDSLFSAPPERTPVRKFSPEYLRRTREGMWEQSREALAPLSLADRERILDAGSGTGELARVLDEESPGRVVCLDADPDLLAVAREQTALDVVAGDATRPPFQPDSFDLVVCQALLVNLPNPVAALRAFADCSTELVAAVEPDNADVGVDSTVAAEVELEQSVREAYIEGVETDVAMGDRLVSLFRDAGLEAVQTRRYYHRKLIEPPCRQSRKKRGKGCAIDPKQNLADGQNKTWKAGSRSETTQRESPRRPNGRLPGRNEGLENERDPKTVVLHLSRERRLLADPRDCKKRRRLFENVGRLQELAGH